MGLFNLIPLSPLDGSKILFALLPDRIYYTILRYEKYVMGVVILLVLVGCSTSPVLPDGPCPTGLLHPHRNASGRVAAVPGRVCYFKSVLR